MRDKISVGVIGAGTIVFNVHLPVLLSIPDVRVAWVTDTNPARASYVHDAYGVPTFASPESPDGLPDADVVLVAVPYGARAPYYDAFSRGQRSVYAEKPFSRSLHEHVTLCESFQNWRIGCGFQYRSSGQVRFLRHIVEDKLFGDLRSVEIGHGSRGNLQSTRYGSNLQLAGGGILFEVGVHIIDALLFAVGARDTAVQSGRMLRHDGIDVHTEASFVFSTPEFGEVSATLVVSGMEPTIGGIRLHFDSAVVSFSREGKLSIRTIGSGRDYSLASPHENTVSTPFQMVYSHWMGFLESIRQQECNWTSAANTTLTTRLIEQLYALPD